MKPVMLKEIHEQPAALEKTLRLEARNVRDIAERIKKFKPAFIMLVARGSSDNAATYAKYLFECANGIPCALAAPSVFTIYGKSIELSRSVVIGISQSGEGTDLNEVLADARRQGAVTVGVTNSAGSAMTAVTEHTIMLRAGKEKALAATKTFTAQLLALAMLSEALLDGKSCFDALGAVPDQLERVLSAGEAVRDIAPRFRFMERCVIIGRGYNYSTVEEAALKMMETSYVAAQPFSTADFMHGPIAMTGAGFPVFIAAASGAMASSVEKLTADLAARGAETIVVSSRKSALAKAVIPIRLDFDPPEKFSPLFYITAFQFLACHIAVSKGIDPDAPRFLKKVTRTR